MFFCFHQSKLTFVFLLRKFLLQKFWKCLFVLFEAICDAPNTVSYHFSLSLSPAFVFFHGQPMSAWAFWMDGVKIWRPILSRGKACTVLSFCTLGTCTSPAFSKLRFFYKTKILILYISVLESWKTEVLKKLILEQNKQLSGSGQWQISVNGCDAEQPKPQL